MLHSSNSLLTDLPPNTTLQMLSRYITPWLKNLSCLPSTHRLKCNSPVWLSRTFTIPTIVPLHLYLLLFRKHSKWPRPSLASRESHVHPHLWPIAPSENTVLAAAAHASFSDPRQHLLLQLHWTLNHALPGDVVSQALVVGLFRELIRPRGSHMCILRTLPSLSALTAGTSAAPWETPPTRHFSYLCALPVS